LHWIYCVARDAGSSVNHLSLLHDLKPSIFPSSSSTQNRSFSFLALPTLKPSFLYKDLRFSIVLSPSRSPLLLVQERGREGEMPIIETLEPRAPEELQLKIFATKTGEDYLIIQAVSEHVLLPLSPFCTPSSSPALSYRSLPFFTQHIRQLHFASQ